MQKYILILAFFATSLGLYACKNIPENLRPETGQLPSKEQNVSEGRPPSSSENNRKPLAGYDSRSDKTAAEEAGFSSPENYYAAKWRGFSDPVIFKEAKSRGFIDKKSYLRAQKLGFDDAKTYEAAIRAGFRDPNAYKNAVAAGFKTKSDLIAARDGGFSDSETFYKAKADGFSSKQKYQEAKAQGFKTAIDYQSAKNSGFENAEKFYASKKQQDAEFAIQSLKGEVIKWHQASDLYEYFTDQPHPSGQKTNPNKKYSFVFRVEGKNLTVLAAHSWYIRKGRLCLDGPKPIRGDGCQKIVKTETGGIKTIGVEEYNGVIDFENREYLKKALRSKSHGELLLKLARDTGGINESQAARHIQEKRTHAALSLRDAFLFQNVENLANTYDSWQGEWSREKAEEVEILPNHYNANTYEKSVVYRRDGTIVDMTFLDYIDSEISIETIANELEELYGSALSQVDLYSAVNPSLRINGKAFIFAEEGAEVQSEYEPQAYGMDLIFDSRESQLTGVMMNCPQIESNVFLGGGCRYGTRIFIRNTGVAVFAMLLKQNPYGGDEHTLVRRVYSPDYYERLFQQKELRKEQEKKEKNESFRLSK